MTANRHAGHARIAATLSPEVVLCGGERRDENGASQEVGSGGAKGQHPTLALLYPRPYQKSEHDGARHAETQRARPLPNTSVVERELK